MPGLPKVTHEPSHASIQLADVEVIHRAMDTVHLRLIAREDESHIHWYWEGHDGVRVEPSWSSRNDAIAYMRRLLDGRGDGVR